MSHYNLLLLAFTFGLLTGCASSPDIKPAPVVYQAPVKKVPEAVSYALSLQGAPYKFGSASPEEGFDCSGFVKYVYEKNGVKLPRTVTEMAEKLPHVPKNQMNSGDLVFFNTVGNSPSHVGIYVNENNFIHAPSARTGKVSVSSLKNHYWEERFLGVARPTSYIEPSKRSNLSAGIGGLTR